MSLHELSKRYAKALLVVSKEKGSTTTVLADLKKLQPVFSDVEVANFFASPIITQEQKVELIKKAVGSQKVSDETMNLIVLLAKNGRLTALSEVVNAFQLLIDFEAGVTRGVVRTAKPISPETQKELEQKITETLKKKIVLTYKEDSSLLGGVIADVGGWTFDDSIESHLRRMNEELIKN